MSIKFMEEELEKYLSILRERDSQLVYDKNSHILSFKMKNYNLAEKTVLKLLEHYNTYMIDHDYAGAKDTIEKIEHFFSMYNFKKYFRGYYKIQNNAQPS